MDINGADRDGFGPSRRRFEQVVGFLDGAGAAGLTHAELEDELEVAGRDLLRLLLQDHLEQVVDAAGVDRGSVEAGHQRTLASVFGPVTVSRLAYRRRGHANLHPPG